MACGAGSACSLRRRVLGVVGRMRLMRCSEARRISSLVRPRGHTTTSAIAKSDFSLPAHPFASLVLVYAPPLTNSDTPPVPPAAVPKSTPFNSSCDPAFVPHMTTQSVFGLTLPW
eukprot:scaffold13320_cov90-Phaeocystis_antarctica.AAC.2